jgi:hypothetical protein
VKIRVNQWLSFWPAAERVFIREIRVIRGGVIQRTSKAATGFARINTDKPLERDP